MTSTNKTTKTKSSTATTTEVISKQIYLHSLKQTDTLRKALVKKVDKQLEDFSRAKRNDKAALTIHRLELAQRKLIFK